MKTIDVRVCSKSSPWQGQGIGDVIQSLPVVAAVDAANPDCLVRAVVKKANLDWALLGWPNVADQDKRTPPDKELWPHHDVLETDLDCIKLRTNRQALWAANLGLEPVPVTPKISAASTARAAASMAEFKDKPIVWVAPFAANPTRQWKQRRWAELVCFLQGIGCNVLGMQCRHDPASIRWIGCPVFQPDEEAEYSAALLAQGDLFIGNDSGLTHLAGWLGVPSVAVCALIPGEVVFGCYPSVVVINAAMECAGCIGRKESGWREWCYITCDALDAIEAEEVFTVAKGMLANKGTPCPI